MLNLNIPELDKLLYDWQFESETSYDAYSLSSMLNRIRDNPNNKLIALIPHIEGIPSTSQAYGINGGSVSVNTISSINTRYTVLYLSRKK